MRRRKVDHEAVVAALDCGERRVEIARALGVSPQLVTQIGRKHGIAPQGPTWTAERRAVVREMWAKGLSAGQIAVRIGGVSRNAVIGIIHRMGLSGRVTTSRLTQSRAATRQRRKREGRILARPKSFSERIMMAPLPPDEPPSHSTVHLLERRDDQCCWIIGEAIDQMMCGAPAIPGLRPAWCSYHAAKGLGTPVPKRSAPVIRTGKVEA